MKTSDLTTLAVVGAAAYVVWRLGQLGGKGQEAYADFREDIGRPVTPDALELFMNSSFGDVAKWVADQFTADLVTQGMEAEEIEYWALKTAREKRQRENRDAMYERIGENSAL